MKKRNFLLTTMVFLFIGFTSLHSEEPNSRAVVNFANCITDSKYGKQEQEQMEGMRKQMSSMIEDTEKELKEIASKLEDSEYLDSLSPKAEEELKVKFQQFNEDLARYQNQFYQILNQSNYQMIQRMNQLISKAAEKIAKQKNIHVVLNRDYCFYFRPEMDITDLVINELDQNYEIEAKNKKMAEAKTADGQK